MAVPSADLEAKLEALHLDAEECEEARYHRFLADVMRPIGEAITDLHQAAAEGRCAEWAATHRGRLEHAAATLRESDPPTWMAVYRNTYLASVDLLLRAAACWCSSDAKGAHDCAELAEATWADAEELSDELL
jgi:hypothetical protein